MLTLCQSTLIDPTGRWLRTRSASVQSAHSIPKRHGTEGEVVAVQPAIQINCCDVLRTVALIITFNGYGIKESE